ncbi:hypothetical protein [Paludisphaera borealis]|uniref:hypothetical protein n=1 Tax=Paludisphaera borealis TaxID=1387353 RepID=UPI000970BAC4|nr:hypothetical protein [Paludisphaera borealis]
MRDRLLFIVAGVSDPGTLAVGLTSQRSAAKCGEDASKIVVRIALHIMMMPVRTTSRLGVEPTPQAVEVALNATAHPATLVADNDVFV